MFGGRGLLVGADSFGQAPVEDHHLAEISHHNILTLQVTVDNAP